MKLLIKRGLLADIGTLDEGRLYLATDTYEVYIGTSDGNKKMGHILLDEDDMVSDSNTQTATQQSIKAYVDTRLSAVNATDLTDGEATTLHKHDHGNMDGLADDDHTQYVKKAGDTMTGALIVRQVTDEGMDETNGTEGEIVYNLFDNKFYGCTVTGTPATWVAFH